MLTLAGCTSALPTFSGGSTTARYRTDVGFGGAARVPVGKLRDNVVTNPYRERVEAGGVVPTAYVRRGLNERFDLGIMVSGTDVRLDFRGEKVLSPEPTIRTAFVYALAPFGGWIVEDDNSGSGGRAGLDVPLVYGIDFGGVYELWLGPRVTNEYIWGNFPLAGLRPRATAIGLRAGAVIGMALGLRRIHAMIELTAAWEQWWGEHSTTSLNHGGVVLIPAFGLRIRI